MYMPAVPVPYAYEHLYARRQRAYFVLKGTEARMILHATRARNKWPDVRKRALGLSCCGVSCFVTKWPSGSEGANQALAHLTPSRENYPSPFPAPALCLAALSQIGGRTYTYTKAPNPKIGNWVPLTLRSVKRFPPGSWVARYVCYNVPVPCTCIWGV